MPKHFLALLILFFGSLHAFAATTTFRTWGSPWLYSVPITEYDKPLEGWLSDGTLIVHILTTATSTSAIDSESGKILVQGDQITLCYKMKEVKYPPGAPIAGVAYTQALEYTIFNLPKKRYSYQISRNCK